MARFVYDKDNLRFKLKKSTFRSVVWKLAKYLFLSLAAAIVFYLAYALVFDTGREKALMMENRAMKEQIAVMSGQLDLLEMEVRNLETRDRDIYNAVFDSDPPEYDIDRRDTLSAGDLLGRSESSIVEESSSRVSGLEKRGLRIESLLRGAESSLSLKYENGVHVPSSVPLRNFSIIQTGASVGKKVNPFFKTVRDHGGIDLLAPAGTDVLCPADGRVSGLEKDNRTFGLRVTVEHGGGYVTTYSHLSEISVREGQTVSSGDVIGKVGLTGTVFAPCLHYEVLLDGKIQDPVDYFFADLTPSEYREMMEIAATTGQSMD